MSASEVYVPGPRVSLRRGHLRRPSIGLSHQRLLVHGFGLVLIVRLHS